MSYTFRSSVDLVGRDSEPDIVYYNADIVSDANDPTSLGLDKDPPIRFSETRTVPLISDISKYMFSIIRFTMDGAGKDLPIFIPKIDSNQSDINLTTYSITYDYTVYYTHPTTSANTNITFTAQRFVEYFPETLYAPLPNSPNAQLPDGSYVGQDLRGRYYFVYTYQHWLDLVNSAFNNAWNDAQPAVAGTYHPTLSIVAQWNAHWASIGGTSGNRPTLRGTPPYITYDRSSGLFSLYGNVYSFGDSLTPLTAPTAYTAWSWNNGTPSYATSSVQGTELMKLYFNTNMMGLFDNFSNFYIGDELPYGKTNQILFQNLQTNISQPLNTLSAFSTTAGANPTVSTSTISYWVMTQDYNSTSTLWNPISSIVFSSTMIPIFPEQTGVPLTYGEGNNNVPSESSSAFTPIITDISVPMERADDYRGFLSYTPTGEYRLSSFTGSRAELRNIDIQVFWKNRLNNQLYPISMFNLSSVSIKMMFRKK